MKLGWWRDRGGQEHQVKPVTDSATEWKWESVFRRGLKWRDDGTFSCLKGDHSLDLIEFLRPLDADLPPALNSAVKAAEDRVRELKQLVEETQTAWATACRLHEAAKRELERLEKECEVKP